MTTGEGFARPEYLVDAEWVAAHRNDPNVVVVDGDLEAGYLRGHIPGAVLVPDNYEKDPDTGRVHILPPDKFAAMCQNLGIGDDTLLVAYDNNQSLYAARLWWALNYYGHSNVKVLDGGWRRWVAEGRAISFDRSAPPGANSGVKFTPRIDESVMVKVDELKAACSLSDALIWDVRSDGEYTGANGRGNKRAGHVPGAVHLEWFNRDSHCFKPAAEIRQLLSEKGITPDKAVFAY